MRTRDPLDELLDRGDGVPEQPAHLLTKIRSRLSAAAAAQQTHWWREIEAAFARPSFAALFVAACVLLGLFLAEARLSRLHAERSTQLARSYQQLIDPLIAAANAPKRPQP